MKKNLSHSLILILLCLLGTLALSPVVVGEDTAQSPRPIEAISDILAWKSIRSSIISSDGAWFAYVLAPQEGDGEVVLRQTKGEKELRFPIGEPPRMGGGAPAFSEGGRWVAYTVFPTRQEARQAKKTKKLLYNSVALLDLRTEKEHKFEKIKGFRFSGENPSWVALHRNPPEAQSKEKDKWNGSDLLLFELSTGKTLNLGNVSEFAFDKYGNWLAWLVDAQDQGGNGVQVRNMQTGVIMPLDSAEAEYKRLTWTEKGEGFAVLKGVKHDDFEDKLFSILGFNGFGAQGPQKASYDPQEDDSFPEKMTISPNRSPQWTEDLTGILFGIHEATEIKDKKAKADEKSEDKEKKPEADEPGDTPEDKS
ncbi:MAG: hypothetical protein WBB73_06245 [Candidatus Aminicenantaceae bacterium]